MLGIVLMFFERALLVGTTFASATSMAELAYT